ncbi:hypothetical protein CHL78_005830 [Romboutsia weinsteinii]|uniref:Replicative DNA helicase n=1 Tax=Romboutsia weinsteinii TaxID=2020949 RepID=A0A371J6Y0_9FIRM|nr:hypothetical protein [Romboutsia weinsteinii]RDY28416.1 hypothetical protein CHL78_005830 [Romboutsia weinsteinii]
MNDVLNNFYSRMRNIAPQALLHKSIERKEVLASAYGFEEFDEKVSIVYALLVYILQQSLKDEECTLKDMAEYLEFINIEYFHKDIEHQNYTKLANCIVNEIILNDGTMTAFRCLDIEKNEYKKVYVQLVEHERSSTSNDATYKLTEMGYNLILSTLEMESNMKLAFHEFVFRESLRRKNFDQALIDIKNIFALSKKQIKALIDGIVKIRENITTFPIEEYNRITNESVGIAETQTDKFKGYEREIELIEQELKEKEFEFKYTNDRDQKELEEIREKLKKLDLIKKETSKVVYEHASMMSKHYEFKEEFTRALDNSIEYFKRDRINIKEELSNLVAQDLSKLEFLEFLLSPLFIKNMKKDYCITTAFDPQKSKIIEEESGTKVILKIDQEEQMIQKKIQEQKNKEKLEQYENILGIIFKFGAEIKQDFMLSEFINYIKDTDEFEILTKNMYQLREVFIELLDLSNFNIKDLKKAARMLQVGYDNSGDFQPLKAILAAINNNNLKNIQSIKLSKIDHLDKVKITMDCMELTVNNIQFEFTLQ